MSQPNSELSGITTEDSASRIDELDLLLARAAELAAAHALDSQTFIDRAMNAFFDARPGLREELEDQHLKKELRKLRKRGLVGSA